MKIPLQDILAGILKIKKLEKYFNFNSCPPGFVDGNVTSNEWQTVICNETVDASTNNTVI